MMEVDKLQEISNCYGGCAVIAFVFSVVPLSYGLLNHNSGAAIIGVCLIGLTAIFAIIANHYENKANEKEIMSSAKPFQCSNSTKQWIDLSKIVVIDKVFDDVGYPCLKLVKRDEKGSGLHNETVSYSKNDANLCNLDFQLINQALNRTTKVDFVPAVLPIYSPTKGNVMESVKEYFNKHRDAIYTLGVVILLDHFLFGGAFREKIKSTVEGMLEKVTKGLSDGK